MNSYMVQLYKSDLSSNQHLKEVITLENHLEFIRRKNEYNGCGD